MEHISLYRKWRPRDFSEVVGQPHVTGTLANALSSGRISHAYLFCGPRGTGKTSTARILAKAINCVDGPTSVPCNNCEACISITQGTALDVIEIDAASNRKIDEIRELLERIPYSPTSLRTKVYIIDEVHQLTPEASSALLKTLEEPPGHVVFVLATTEPHKILPTIVSRCQRFDFTLVPTQEIAGLLTRIASRESIDIDSEAISMIAEHAHGSMRDAISVMDQISNLSGETVTQHEVAGLLGEVESDLIFEMLDIIAEKDTPGALALVGRVVDSGKEPRRFVESMITYLRSLFLIQNAAHPREVVEATDEHYARLEDRSHSLRRHEVLRLIERLGEAHREMRWSESSRLVLECTLVKTTRLDADLSLDGIAFRLDEIERKLAALAEGEPPVSAPGSNARPAGRPGRAWDKEPAESGEVRADAAAGNRDRAAGASDEGGAAKRGKERPAGEMSGGPGSNGVQAEPAHTAGPVEPGDFESAEEKDRMRRAWLAVLSELKNRGQLRLYALLSRSRVTGAGPGEVTLGFPEDASFQIEILSEPGMLEQAEVAWEHCVGDPVKLLLTTVEARDRKRPAGALHGADAPEHQAGKPGGRRKAVATEEKENRPGPVEPPGDVEPTGVDQPLEGGGTAGESRSKESARELAEKIKESFDGEII